MINCVVAKALGARGIILLELFSSGERTKQINAEAITMTSVSCGVTSSTPLGKT